MKVANLTGNRFKERPADCVVESHALMVKGGYMKYVGNGIYSELPPLRRITKKIEAIIRDEMDKIDGQEVLFPVVMPAELWEQSGRYESVGSELLRFQDRNGAKMVLGMTHEEAAVHLVKDYASSYTKYPFMIYQIQRKFRDEARPRAGMIRVREFTMKDAYSFHTSQEDLEQYYKRCYDAYHRIFKRAGIPEVVAVASDSGMMGGNVSHEYMLLTPAGEDSIVICESCDFCANMEMAESIVQNVPVGLEEKEEVYTPHCKTIEDVCKYLKKAVKSSCKAVVYQKNEDDSYVVVFIRGDLEVNETKLRNYLGGEVHTAVITPECGLVPGYIGFFGLDAHVQPIYDMVSDADTGIRGQGTPVQVVFDTSLKGIDSMVAGANRENYHYTGLNIQREIGEVNYRDVAKAVSGGICPCCGKPTLTVQRGIEVGNIFQLGTKYSKSMDMQYVDENGESHYPIMGCYGIGVGRLAASICEARHDEYGPIWPITIAPWQVHLCCLRADDLEAKQTADRLYQELLGKGVEVIYDDRNVRAGMMFSDADLLGVPIRVVVSPRNLKESKVEISTRDKSVQCSAPLEEAVGEILKLREKLFAEIENIDCFTK